MKVNYDFLQAPLSKRLTSVYVEDQSETRMVPMKVDSSFSFWEFLAIIVALLVFYFAKKA